jgi:hypothetical protein
LKSINSKLTQQQSMNKLADMLINSLPSIKQGNILCPDLTTQEKLWERLSYDIEWNNQRLPIEQHYLKDIQAQYSIPKDLHFSYEQLNVFSEWLSKIVNDRTGTRSKTKSRGVELACRFRDSIFRILNTTFKTR